MRLYWCLASLSNVICEVFESKQQDAPRSEVVKVEEFVVRRFVFDLWEVRNFSIEPSAPKVNGYESDCDVLAAMCKFDSTPELSCIAVEAYSGG